MKEIKSPMDLEGYITNIKTLNKLGFHVEEVFDIIINVLMTSQYHIPFKIRYDKKFKMFICKGHDNKEFLKWKVDIWPKHYYDMAKRRELANTDFP